MRSQGVVSGTIQFNGTEYLELFDQKYKYLFVENNDPFIMHGNWVEYKVIESRYGPKNCKYMATDMECIETADSNAPISDVFRSNSMNVSEYNKVDYFSYAEHDNNYHLEYKSSIKCHQYHGKFTHPYYGEVHVNMDALRRLSEHGIQEIDAIMKLRPSTTYSGGPHWEVIHFVYQGKNYSINGFLSITGRVLRGPGGAIRNRNEVFIAPDSLRPIGVPTSTISSTRRPEPVQRTVQPPKPANQSSNWGNSTWTEEQAPPTGCGFGVSSYSSPKKETSDGWANESRDSGMNSKNKDMNSTYSDSPKKETNENNNLKWGDGNDSDDNWKAKTQVQQSRQSHRSTQQNTRGNGGQGNGTGNSFRKPQGLAHLNNGKGF